MITLPSSLLVVWVVPLSLAVTQLAFWQHETQVSKEMFPSVWRLHSSAGEGKLFRQPISTLDILLFPLTCHESCLLLRVRFLVIIKRPIVLRMVVHSSRNKSWHRFPINYCIHLHHKILSFSYLFQNVKALTCLLMKIMGLCIWCWVFVVKSQIFKLTHKSQETHE